MVYRGRTDGMNQWKSAHAVETKARTLAEALVGCDVFLGLSVKGAVTQEMVKTMAKAPIIFAMANPDPEITPEDVKAVRPDAIVATGRSDYPNQVNNVLGFPYIFRGALDVRARTINEAMKIAAAEALAALAREDVPDEVAAAYRGARPVYGPDYIIPVPFDPRLISRVSPRGGGSGDQDRRGAARDERSRRLSLSTVGAARSLRRPVPDASPPACAPSPSAWCSRKAKRNAVIRAASAFQNSGLGKALLVGRADVIAPALQRISGIGRARAGNPRAAFGAGSHALYRARSTSACSGAAGSIATRAHGDQRPQHLCRLDAGGGRCRRDGDGRHPQLCRRADRCAHGARRRRRACAPSACR